MWHVLKWFGLAAVLWVVLACQRAEQQRANPLFEELTPQQTGVTFSNILQETEAFNIIQYLYFYNGGGVATGDVNNDGLTDLYFSANQGPNKLYLNRGNFQFEDVTERAGVAGTGSWKTGVSMADVNGDGWLDIYVCQVGSYKSIVGRNQLFINLGNGAFAERAAEYGLDFKGFSTHAAFFDYDADGDLDLYLLNHSVHAAENYGPAAIRQRREPLAGDRLYRNDGGKFTDVSELAGIFGSRIGYGLGVAISDLNLDGLPDVYVANDFHENDYLYYNNGDGTFTEAIRQSMQHTSNFSMGCDIADYNNDGRPDVFTLDMKPAEETVLKRSAGTDPYNIYLFKLGYGYHFQFPRNMLQLHSGLCASGMAHFTEIGQLAGIAATDWSWSVLCFDMDNDGWKDVFISNGIRRRLNDLDYLNFISNEQIQRNATDLEMARRMPDGAVPNFAFRNQADLTFQNVSAAWGLNRNGYSNGAAWADLDNDGDLDLVVNNLDAPASVYRNRAAEQTPNRYLAFQLKGEGANTHGVGAQVWVAAGGRVQMQEHYASRGFQSSVAPGLHFGLGQASQADSVLVIWPDQRVQILRQVQAGQRLVLHQRDARPAPLPDWKTNRKPEALLESGARDWGLDFVHRENEPSDFDREKLMPFMTSTPGPRIAVGDMDGDGREDLFIGGAHGQAGALYRQNANGFFEAIPCPALEKDSLYEDAAAVWFDADADNDLDLYVVSGGGEDWAVPDGHAFQDRLYLNDGKGAFSKAPKDALPAIHSSGACVAVLDFDADGRPDLFVGGYSIPNQYGLPPRSYLLRNAGRGRFEDATPKVAPDLLTPGMVTASVWDAPQRTLVVAGHWMPVALYTFEKGKAARRELPQSHGWWNALALTDANGDGRTDILAGNWGLNSEFRPSATEPISLLVADFDGNGSTDPVMTYFRQGKRYTYFGRDELARQMVGLKKRYTDYQTFAEAGLDKIFPSKTRRKAAQMQVFTLASTLFLAQSDGSYGAVWLPSEAQMAPICAFALADFNEDGFQDAVCAGNYYETQPAIGRMSAAAARLLVGNGKGGFRYATSGLDCLDGQYRDAKLLAATKVRPPLLVLAGNHAALRVWALR